MFEAFFESNTLLFTIPALVGTFFFLLRTVLMLVGGLGDADFDTDMDIDIDVDVDVDADIDASDIADSTHAFNILSIQGIAGFIMGFGWGGLIGKITLEWDILTSSFLGIAGGLAMAWILVWMFRLIYSLQSSGNVLIDDAIGKEGTVYAQIPIQGQGRGQVQVVINERSRIYNAVTEGQEIPTHSRIRVTRVNDDNTLTVIAT